MRVLNKLIEDYIDERIAKWEPSIQPTDLKILALKAMIGIHEEGGDNCGALVSAIQATVGDPDHWAWCMSLQQTSVAYTEKKLGITSSLMANEHCLTVFNDSVKRKITSDTPIPGDLIIWQQGDTQAGHTGCVIGVNDDYLICIEGNTGDGIGIVRDGDGVYLRKRARGKIGLMKPLGFVRAPWLPQGAN